MPTKGRLLAEGRTAEVFAWGEDEVLKLYREGWPKENVEYEHQKALASQQTGLSVPVVRELIELDGRYGLVFQRVEGKTLLTLLRTRPWQVFRYAKIMARLQADMHTRTAVGLPNLHDNLKRKIEGTDKLDETIKQVLYDRLAQLPQDNKLCHGDFHPDNILMTKNGAAVVIDWVDGAQGHPLADLARTHILIIGGDIPEFTPGRRLIELLRNTFYKAFIKEYFKHSPYAPEDLEPWIPIIAGARLREGIKEEEESLIRIAKTSLI